MPYLGKKIDLGEIALKAPFDGRCLYQTALPRTPKHRIWRLPSTI